MDSPISLQDVANIVTFLAPGYFAMQVYYWRYSKRDREFARIFIESVIFSLPIVSFTNFLWEKVFQRTAVGSLDVEYAPLLLCVAVLCGALVTYLRVHWPVQQFATKLGFGSPDDDFAKVQLERIDYSNKRRNSVTVTLKSGAVFSGTVEEISKYSHEGDNFYCFTNLAWFNQTEGVWDERKGNLIVSRSEIEYIETSEISAAKMPRKIAA